MPTFEEYVHERVEKEPSYLRKLEEAKASLRLGIGISEQRQGRNWTQRHLAEEAGMPQSSVARYEQAANTPSIPNLWRLADALNAWFVFGPNHFVHVFTHDPTEGVLAPSAGIAAVTRPGQETLLLADQADHITWESGGVATERVTPNGADDLETREISLAA